MTLKLKRPDHTILTRSQTLPEPTDKAHMLFDVGSALLARETGGRKRYRLMGIGADQLGPPAGGSLLDLSDDTTLRRNNLEAAIDDLHHRLGQDALQSGRVFSRKAKPERDATRQRAAIESLDIDAPENEGKRDLGDQQTDS